MQVRVGYTQLCTLSIHILTGTATVGGFTGIFRALPTPWRLIAVFLFILFFLLPPRLLSNRPHQFAARCSRTLTPSAAHIVMPSSFFNFCICARSVGSIASNCCNILTNTKLASVRANCWPRQIRGPPLKGRNCHAGILCSNLAGLNSFASSPQTMSAHGSAVIKSMNLGHRATYDPSCGASGRPNRTPSRLF